MKNKKILIFGFKPYGRYKTNISEIIVNKLHNKERIEKIILPIDFDRDIILKKIKETKQDIILGLSQKPRARKIKIERKAKNIIKLKKEKKSRSINKNAGEALFVNLSIDKTKGTTTAYNVGTYVCNFTMYIIINYINKHNKNIKFAFLHIPKSYNVNKGMRIINKILDNSLLTSS